MRVENSVAVSDRRSGSSSGCDRLSVQKGIQYFKKFCQQTQIQVGGVHVTMLTTHHRGSVRQVTRRISFVTTASIRSGFSPTALYRGQQQQPVRVLPSLARAPAQVAVGGCYLAWQ